ncbi:MAG: cation transporter [Acidobacteriota bacterium]|nr:cation transporter [Acidobacteriota bacterium]MDE3170841.1 cation transporter [Acidobacteriota bacterium]
MDHYGHDHADHGHGLGQAVTNLLGAAVAATVVLVIIEFVAGFAGNSLALVSDGIHNLTDIPGMAISWLAARWATRPPTHEKTFGYHRAGILAAFANALVLGLAALGLISESVLHLRHPEPVETGLMMGVAVIALLINGGITFAVHRGRRDLNVRTVWIHNLGDALFDVAIFVGALAIHFTGAVWVDPALGIGIGVVVLWTSGGILRESGHILLEGLPRALQLQEVASAILKIPPVREVHDVHIWTLGTGLNALSCHVRIPDMHMEESEKLLLSIRNLLEREFQITHTTIQFERAGLPAQSGPLMPAPARRSAH